MIRRKIASSTASREVVLKLKTSEDAKRAVRSMATAKQKSRSTSADISTPLRQVLASKEVKSVEPLFVSGEEGKTAKAEGRLLLSVTEEGDSALAGLNVLRLDEGADAAKIAQSLSEDELVDYAHEIPPRFLMARRTRKGGGRRRVQSSATEPLEDQQWGLRAVKLYKAQQLDGFEEATDIVVAVIDTGVDSNHPDLSGVLSEERSFTSGPLKDTMGHGTHVIGIIAAHRNGDGIAGICQSRKIMSLKALGPYDGPGYYRAIRHATDNGANVINLSLGGPYDPTEELLIKRAIENGLVVVAAMGNEFQEGNPTSYPAAIGDVIAIGASTKSDRRARFSNTGRHIDLVAPGVDILSTVPTYNSNLTPETDYDSWDGTSMATPFVSGAVALLLAAEPDADLNSVRRALKRGSDLVPGQNGFSRHFGWGRLNVRRALKKVWPA